MQHVFTAEELAARLDRERRDVGERIAQAIEGALADWNALGTPTESVSESVAWFVNRAMQSAARIAREGGDCAAPPDTLRAAVEAVAPTPDDTPPSGLDWRDGLDALDALLDDCSQVGEDYQNHVRVSAVRDIVRAIRRYEDDTDESIRSALMEDAIERGYDPEADRATPRSPASPDSEADRDE